jgi:hypothetical protein
MAVVPEKVFIADKVQVPAPVFVNPPVPLITPDKVPVPMQECVIKYPPLSIVPDIVSVPPEATAIVGAAVLKVIFKLMVIVKLVLFAAIAAAPPLNTNAFPDKVYALAPAPKVMEAKLVPATISFEFERFAAPDGKTNASPVVGTAFKSQLAAVFQRLLELPSHVYVAENTSNALNKRQHIIKKSPLFTMPTIFNFER